MLDKLKTMFQRPGGGNSASGGRVLASLLALPFGLYYAAAHLPRPATAGLLGLLGVLMFLVLKEG